MVRPLSVLIDTSRFAELFCDDVPLLDVRAEVEYSKGAFPSAINIPILNDDERREVGICYNESGPEAAARLGHRLVSGASKEDRMQRWLSFAENYPEGYLYCFRGGERSRIAQQWLSDAGCHMPRIEGGYRQLRRFLLDSLHDSVDKLQLIVLGGKTGTGKTELLNRIDASVDLEGLACHRGSAFGRRLAPQPTQINFENCLAISLLKIRSQNRPLLALEDESLLIGKLNIPQFLYDKMDRTRLILLQDSIENRVDRIFDEYIVAQLGQYESVSGSGPIGFEKFSAYLTGALSGISKRLGGERYKRLSAVMQEALSNHQQGDPLGHREWIRELLLHYYDPMYAYQLKKKEDRVMFTGNSSEVFQWFQQHLQPS